MNRESGGPSAEAGNSAGEDDGASRAHHPKVLVDPAPTLDLTHTDPAKQASADEVLARAGTGVPGEVEVSAAEAVLLVEAGIADPASIAILKFDDTADVVYYVGYDGSDGSRRAERK